jgi:co-chaperonin GroES (HSP10)
MSKTFPYIPNVGQVVCLRKEKQKFTAGGLTIPDDGVRNPEAVVVAVNEVKFVTVGDEVLLRKSFGADIKIEGVEYAVLEEAGVLLKRKGSNTLKIGK